MTTQSFTRTGPLVGFLLASCSGPGSVASNLLGSAGNQAGSVDQSGDAGTSSVGDTGTKVGGNYPGGDLGLPPVAAGFVRYETQPVMVPPGGDVMWVEWVAAPLTAAMDVVKISGKQSTGGHHAILFGTTNVQSVGTSHSWQNADQLGVRTLASVGGDGSDVLQLPAGVVFRVPKGDAFMIQSHYINAGATPIQGRTVLDVQLGPVDPTAQVASSFANATLTVSLPPGARTTKTVSCKVQSELRFLMYTNHMHDYGVSVSTELVRPDGTKTVLKNDPMWTGSWAFHPNYTHFTLQAPALIPSGSTVNTTCTWVNTKSTTLSFPDEMCTFAGSFLGISDADCVDGVFL